VVADGPRAGRAEEQNLCETTRNITNGVDWPCEVLTNFSNVNMGCALRVASGLDWAFEHTEEAIILEDDCLPDPTFFPYCSELLDRYRADERVLMISGNNFQNGRRRGSASYYFSAGPNCWGWATWRRAWRLFDFSMTGWGERRATDWLKQFTRSPMMRSYWTRCFDGTISGAIDSWGYRWRYSVWAHEGLCIVPEVNLVTNIGFNERGTHTLIPDDCYQVPAVPIKFPLRHADRVEQHKRADTFEQSRLFLSRFRLRDRALAYLVPLINDLRPLLAHTRLWTVARALLIGPAVKLDRPPTARGLFHGTQIAVRLSKDQIQLIDNWRAEQPGKPGRAEAVRRMIEIVTNRG
jgi:hypothetical protein